MSKSGEVRKIIEHLFSDGNIHDVQEVISEALYQGVITNPEDASVRNAFYQYKKNNSDFRNVGKGKYQKKTVNTMKPTDKIDEFDEKIEYILKEIRRIKQFDWINCEEEEIFENRKRIEKIKKISLELEKIIR